jgi:hypothetical protein
VSATALATVSTPAQKRGSENEQTVLDVVVEAFLQGRVLRRFILLARQDGVRRRWPVSVQIVCTRLLFGQRHRRWITIANQHAFGADGRPRREYCR